MKKHVLRVLSSAAVVTALFTLSVFAAEPSSPSEKTPITTMEQLDKRFNLETAAEIPEGAAPPKFNTVQEAAEYLELSERGLAPSLSYTINRTVSVQTTTDAQLSAIISYYKTDTGLGDLASVKSEAVGDRAWTWKQTSYTSKLLDGGRSREIYITGVFTNSVVVGGVLKNYDYAETVYVEI